MDMIFMGNLVFKAMFVVIGGFLILTTERIFKTEAKWNSHKEKAIK